MKENILPKNTLLLWRIRAAAVCVLLMAGFAYFCCFSVWFIAVIIINLVAFVLIIFRYLPIYFRNYKIRLENSVIIINCGVFIKTVRIMPFSKMIYAQSVSTPLAKKLGISSIILKAARSYLLIPEIETEKANDFIRSISRGGGI